MISGVSVTFRFAGVQLGKAVVTHTVEGFAMRSGVFDRSAIRTALGIGNDLAEEVMRDLKTRSVRVAGHFIAQRGKYPFSLDPATRIEAQVVWMDSAFLQTTYSSEL